jgi:hypothetical protein
MYKLLVLILASFLALPVQSQTVFKTPSGAKYHLATCRTVKNVSAEITTAAAMQLGLTACKVCNPQNIYAGAAHPPHKAQGEGNTIQCNGITKAGTRCKHKTSIGNSYCFQHQPV